MNCKKLETLIALYVEGDLPAQKARMIESHLTTCQSCREFAEELRLSQSVLKSLGLDRAPEPSLVRVRASVMSSAAIERPARSLRARRYAIAAGAIMVIAVAVAGLRRGRNDKTPILAINRRRIAGAELMPHAANHNVKAGRAELPGSPSSAPLDLPRKGSMQIDRPHRSLLAANHSRRLHHRLSPRLEGAESLAFGSEPAVISSSGHAEKACRQQPTLLQCNIASVEPSRLPELKVKLMTGNPSIVIYIIVD